MLPTSFCPTYLFAYLPVIVLFQLQFALAWPANKIDSREVDRLNVDINSTSTPETIIITHSTTTTRPLLLNTTEPPDVKSNQSQLHDLFPYSAGCSDQPEIPNGYVKTGESKLGDRRLIICNSGYYLSAHETDDIYVTCDWTGVWTHTGKCVKRKGCVSGEVGCVAKDQSNGKTTEPAFKAEREAETLSTTVNWLTVVLAVALVIGIAIIITLIAVNYNALVVGLGLSSI